MLKSNQNRTLSQTGFSISQQCDGGNHYLSEKGIHYHIIIITCASIIVVIIKNISPSSKSLYTLKCTTMFAIRLQHWSESLNDVSFHESNYGASILQCNVLLIRYHDHINDEILPQSIIIKISGGIKVSKKLQLQLATNWHL